MKTILGLFCILTLTYIYIKQKTPARTIENMCIPFLEVTIYINQRGLLFFIFPCIDYSGQRLFCRLIDSMQSKFHTSMWYSLTDKSIPVDRFPDAQWSVICSNILSTVMNKGLLHWQLFPTSISHVCKSTDYLNCTLVKASLSTNILKNRNFPIPPIIQYF